MMSDDVNGAGNKVVFFFELSSTHCLILVVY